MHRSIRVASLLLTLIFSALHAFAGDPRKDLEESVNKFYDAYIKGNWKTAEKFVDPETVETFRAASKPTIYKYKLVDVQWITPAQHADVRVDVDVLVPQLTVVTTIPARTQWKKIKGKWLFRDQAPPPPPTSPRIEDGFKASGRNIYNPDEKSVSLKFDKIDFDFGVRRQGDIVKIQFPFTNVSDHPVKVKAALGNECHCITVGVSKETLAPGEQAYVDFVLDSTPFTFYYGQGISVYVLGPPKEETILDVRGFLNPAKDNPPTPDSPSK